MRLGGGHDGNLSLEGKGVYNEVSLHLRHAVLLPISNVLKDVGHA